MDFCEESGGDSKTVPGTRRNSLTHCTLGVGVGVGVGVSLRVSSAWASALSTGEPATPAPFLSWALSLLGNLDSSALVRAALQGPWRVSVNLPTFLLSLPRTPSLQNNNLAKGKALPPSRTDKSHHISPKLLCPSHLLKCQLCQERDFCYIIHYT